MRALILIDIQNGLTKKKSLYHEVVFINTVNAAIHLFRESNFKIIFVQHNNKQLEKGSVEWEIDSRIDKLETDCVIQKTQGNAFRDTVLKSILEEDGINSVLIGGLVSHGCIKASCLGGISAEFEISLLKNGHTNWNRDADVKILETENELMKNGVLIESIADKQGKANTEVSLNNLTVAALGKLFPIIIEDYSVRWPDLYMVEANLIRASFAPTEIVRIDHIGSTSIPGLKAKPVIDILLQITEEMNIQKLKDIFTSLGYLVNDHSENPAPHITFVKGYANTGFKGQPYHVHIRYRGDWEEIRFRDYLIQHKEIAKEYESLKLKLAGKYPNDREAYTDSKTEWIERINELTTK